MRADLAESAGDFPAPTGQTVVLIRKRLEGPIVNAWLVSIAVLGALVTVGDGLTRPPLDWDVVSVQPLEYQPYHAVFLFAVVTLPLMFAYAKKARISLVEGLFLWFTFCTTTYMRDFAYLRLSPAPLFVTDVVLAVLLIWIYILPRRQPSHSPLAVHLFLGFFITAGVLSALRGFWGPGQLVLVLRDSALTAYALFLAVGYHLFRSWLSIKIWAVWFLLGTALSVLNGFAWFVVSPDQRRFIFPGIYVLVSLIIVLVTFSNRIIRPIVGWVSAGVFSLGLLLANARSLFVSLAVVFSMVMLVPRLLRAKSRFVSSLVTLIVAAALLSSLALVFFHQRGDRNLTARVGGELASGTLRSSEDPTWQFRISAWKEAWRRFAEYPPAGEGFGVPFSFEIWDNDPRPHNTFLTVLYKMGLTGFIPFFAFLGYFFWRNSVALRKYRKRHHVLFLQIACAVQISFCLYGMANVLLESPHLASLFWVAMGVDLRMIRMLDLEQSLQKNLQILEVSEPLRHAGLGGEESDEVNDLLGSHGS